MMPTGPGESGHQINTGSNFPRRSRQSWLGLIGTCLSVLIGVSALVAALFLDNSNMEATLGYFRLENRDSYWEKHREEVKDVFVTSWDAYSKYAWGKDTFHPISKRGEQMSPSGLGWIIVDSLDTLMVMNLTSQLSEARKWLKRDLTYDQDQDVNTFETTIRMLGGLLSAHYLSTQLPDISSRHDHIYLERAIDLADRLLAAYDSPAGIPYSSVNIGTRQGLKSHTDNGASSTAEATTLQLEMKYLANLTGNGVYWEKAENIMQVVDDHRKPDGLLPIFVSPDTGNFRSRIIRLGSRGDSYYEYLAKQYLQTHEPIYAEMWEEALAGIQKHMITTTKHSNLQIVAELEKGVGGKLSPKMDHLVCFLPGSIAIAATEGRTEAAARKLPTWNPQKEEQMELARELTKTCWAMYAVTETGLSPEITWFNVEDHNLEPNPGSRMKNKSSDDLESWQKDFKIKSADAHNLQRPETVESLFLLFRVTEDPIYRKWGWEIFKSFKEHMLVPSGEGYTSLDDVTTIPSPMRDNMESFWLAETLKYLYLLFSPRDVFPLTEVVFNTEAHIFPRFEPTKFKTGWTRRKRDQARNEHV
ncbi:Glycoside hydrolase family 47 [Penicillium sp. IBT 18751x]|nr:Glycoside hydrolase family 47 [Penicillium sp. IBT 18751x]